MNQNTQPSSNTFPRSSSVRTTARFICRPAAQPPRHARPQSTARVQPTEAQLEAVRNAVLLSHFDPSSGSTTTQVIEILSDSDVPDGHYSESCESSDEEDHTPVTSDDEEDMTSATSDGDFIDDSDESSEDSISEDSSSPDEDSDDDGPTDDYPFDDSSDCEQALDRAEVARNYRQMRADAHRQRREDRAARRALRAARAAAGSPANAQPEA